MSTKYIQESKREIPLIRDVDIVICGGTIAAIAAACEIRKHGKTVCIVAPRWFLGEDLCSTLKLWLDDDEKGEGFLGRALFQGKRTITPYQVKKTFEEICLERGIEFVLGSTVTELVHDDENNLAGLVIANRSGRQAIKAKWIVDASIWATATRLTNARFKNISGDAVKFKRTILGYGSELATKAVDSNQKVEEKTLFYQTYEFDFPVPTNIMDVAELEQRIRDASYQEKQLRSAESIYFDRISTVECRKNSTEWTGFENLDIESFCPLDVERFYLINSFAAIADEDVTLLHKIDNKEKIGRFAGKHAADSVDHVSRRDHLSVAVSRHIEATYDSRELVGIDLDGQTLKIDENSLPVSGSFVVLVIGGGTAGAAAAISAARHGARVMVVEFQEALGGISTIGLIGQAYHGKDIGFAQEVPFPDETHSLEDKMEWLRAEIRKHGGVILIGTGCCGAVVDGNIVKGAVIASVMGRKAILADVVIDATSNADLAIAAGADFMYGVNADDIALQGTGLSTRPLNKNCVNSDYLLVDEADFRDTQAAMVGMRLALDESPYDTCPMIQNREHRRIIGGHILRYLDQIIGRTYPDSVVWSGSDYDSHGYPESIYFALLPHDEKTKKMNHPAPGGECFTPYRCFLPLGLERMFVIGTAISMERDASALIRMQRDIYNQGYAIGLAAMMAIREKCSLDQIDIKALQRELIQVGGLPEDVLTHGDPYPFSNERVEEAVAAYGKFFENNIDKARYELAIILTHKEQARPYIAKAYQEEKRLCHAKLLGCLGENDGVELLIDTLEHADWDEKIYQGMMAEFAHLPTSVDSLVLSLGLSKDRRAIPAILNKAKLLDASSTLSHHRSVAIALGILKAPEAAPLLAELLGKKGMSGHDMPSLEPLFNKPVEKRRREASLRELFLAKALYQCGDHQGVAKQILKKYRDDIRNVFANHARQIIDTKPA